MEAIELLECGHPESEHSSFTRGYGTDKDGKRSCYACCAEADRKQMREAGKITLYLPHDNPMAGTISNWPGSLTFPCRVKVNKRAHNWGLTRYDAWFTFEGTNWHGVQYGDNTQLIHCKRVK